MADERDPEQRALTAAAESGIDYTVVRHGPVNSLAEAADARGVAVEDVVKSIVVRRGEGDYVLVLVPGDRSISWPRLRALLGVNRLSLPDANAARDATGYERGAITPFGTLLPLPVVADERILGRQVSVGGGAPGVALIVSADDLVRVLDATVADVTEPG